MTQLWFWASEKNTRKSNECWGRRDSAFRLPNWPEYESSMRMGLWFYHTVNEATKDMKDGSFLVKYSHLRIQSSYWNTKHSTRQKEEDHPGERLSEKLQVYRRQKKQKTKHAHCFISDADATCTNAPLYRHRGWLLNWLVTS